MSGSFSALANAAIAKADTLDHHATTIASLTVTVAELTATNKRLVEALAIKLNAAKPPPGIPAPATTPATTTLPQTTHILNTAGVACPVTLQKSGRYHFVTGQHCKTCNKANARHVPSDCLELPEHAGRKALVEARNKSKKSGDN